MPEIIYMQFQPLEDRVLIKPIKKTEPEKTEAGIILDMKKKEVGEGIVHAVGNGRFASETGAFMENVLRKGDIVLYGLNVGMALDVPNGDGEKTEMRLMRESDVLLLIKKSE